MTLNDIDYQKLECIHVALQDLQNKYSIPEDDSDLDDAFKFVEDIRDKYLKENEDDNANYDYTGGDSALSPDDIEENEDE